MERAMEGHLAPLGFALVKGYRGEVEHLETVLKGRLPGALILYGGSSYSQRGASLLREMIWTVLVADRYDTVYQRLDAVRQRMHGAQLFPGQNAAPLKIVSEKLWDARESYAAYFLTFRLKHLYEGG